MVIEQFNGRNTIMCVGGSDTGKTTFVKEAVGELAAAGKAYIHIDLDMGQSTIGPPSTIGLRTSEGAQYLYFVGNISPFGVVRELEGGLTRFRRIMDGLPGRQTIVDTTGLVEGPFGWALKRMKIAMLGVDFIIFFDKTGDTRHLRDQIAEMEIATTRPVPNAVRPGKDRRRAGPLPEVPLRRLFRECPGDQALHREPSRRQGAVAYRGGPTDGPYRLRRISHLPGPVQ